MENIINQLNRNVNSNFNEVDNQSISPKTTLDYALKYHQMGLSVISIRSQSKEPAISWREFQDRRPTENEIEGWFSSGKKNIAIVSGNVSGGHFVLECDGHGVFPVLLKFSPWLKTPTLMTQSVRGIHIHLRCKSLPKFLTHLTRKLDGGSVEFRANRTYTLVPPSKHPSGKNYKFINPETLILEISRQQLDELISWFTVPEDKNEDSREAFSGDVPPIDASSAEESLSQAIDLAEPDRSRNIVGFLLALKLKEFELTMAQAFPYMMRYWKALHETGATKYEKWEAKSSLRSAYKDRWIEGDVGFKHIAEELYVKIRQPEHNCAEYHNKTDLFINLKRGVGNGRHGWGNRLDCPGCIWMLARSVTLDMGVNFRDGFWAMTLLLKDKNGIEAIEKRVSRKKDGSGAGIGLTSFKDKEIGIATNFQADEGMQFIPWTDTERMKEFLNKFLSIEPESNGKRKHKIRPFGAFVRRDIKGKENGEFHRLKVPAPWEDVKKSLESMGSLVEDGPKKSMFKLSETALGFFKGIILNDWSGVHTLPLPSDDPLWRARVYKKGEGAKPAKGNRKIIPMFLSCPGGDEAKERFVAYQAQVGGVA